MKKEDLIIDFKKKKYGFFKDASVQVCEWNKNAIREKGKCYKQDFYGADCLSCHQIAPTTFWCNNSCIFCWRPKEYMGKIVKETIDPSEMIEGLIKERKKLLSGFYGYAKKETVDKAINHQKHWAISLSGEPTLYKKLGELIRLIKKRKETETVFVVSNGQNPDVIWNLKKDKSLPTQLYISMISPNEKLYKRITCNTEKNGWLNYLKTLSMLKLLGTRIVIRLTLIKGLNDSPSLIKEFSDLLSIIEPDFIEIKSYMWIGYSRRRLKEENMPSHEYTKEFANQILQEFSMKNYKFENEKVDSRIVLLKNKKSKYKTKIIDRD
ncbi:MAG: radical SAM protein [Candidatus ainarchaeum sp.]|nr:radical SAM protein [Candidatus ainarchaeum sp.]